MSTTGTDDRVAGFLVRALAREGALAERSQGDRVEVVLPPALLGVLAVPEVATLCLSGEPAEGDTAFPLEGLGMQACLERARGRGLRAGARIPGGAGSPEGRARETRRRATPLNGTLLDVGAEARLLAVALLEFSYEARSEERAEGSVFVAVPQGAGAPCLALADALLENLSRAEGEPPALGDPELALAARAAAPLAAEAIGRRLEGFRADRARRLGVEARRVLEYHARLEREASKRGRRAGEGDAGATVAARRAAVKRRCEERLEELHERHAIEAVARPVSVLVLRYQAVVGRVVVRRRQRDVPFDVLWDPHLRDPIGVACAACARPTLAVHVCDEQGHLTCAACARRCPTCSRVACRACRPAGCGCDRAGPQR